MTSTGQLFWSGPKRCPQALEFDINNPLHLDYVAAGANLKAQVYGMPTNRDRSYIAQVAAAVDVSLRSLGEVAVVFKFASGFRSRTLSQSPE